MIKIDKLKKKFKGRKLDLTITREHTYETRAHKVINMVYVYIINKYCVYIYI